MWIPRHGILESGNRLMLDIFPNASAAFSLNRKLLSTYTGSAFRVRRSSDNTEQDIGFLANNNINESSLTSFVGSGDGFITKWYDQSIAGRDFVQTTTSFQPKIVSSGTVLKVNNKLALLVDGVDDRLVMTFTTFNQQTQLSLILVDSPLTNQAADTVGLTRFGFGDVSSAGIALSNNTGLFSGEKLTFAYQKTVTGRLGASTYDFNANTMYLEWLNITTTSTVAFKNSVQTTFDLTSGITTTTDNTPFSLGTTETNIYLGGLINISFASGASGYFSEYILYVSTNQKLSVRTSLEQNINSYYNIY